MTRSTLRRTPMLERLETRQVLSGVTTDLAGQKQYLLELINLVRTNPSAAADRLTTNLGPGVAATLDHYGLSVGGLISKLDNAPPQPPLAESSTLDSIATTQSQYEADTATQTHLGAGGVGLGGRFAAAGYSNPLTEGENTYAYTQTIDQAMQSFLFDWGVADDGHYKNLLQPGTSAQNAYQEVGLGLVPTTNGVGPLVLTQDFGSQQNAPPQILGVSYNDSSHSGFYAPGEGNGGLTIDAVNLATKVKYETQTNSAGGYQMPVAPNADYQVTVVLNGSVVQSQTVHVSDVNSKADFVLDPSQAASTSASSSTPANSSNSAPSTPVPAVPDLSIQAATPPPVQPTVSTPAPTPPAATAPASTPVPMPDPTPTPTPTPVAPSSPPFALPAWFSRGIRWKAINYNVSS